MYPVWIPVMNRKMNDMQTDKLIGQLRRAEPQMVMLIYNRVLWHKEDRQRETALFLENKQALEAAGFSVGAWLCPTIGYGGASYFRDNDAPFTHLKRLNGEDVGDAFCPLDQRFTDDFCEMIQEIASTGVKAILFEDDFTYTGGKGKSVFEHTACCCEAHMAKYRAILGEDVRKEDLRHLLYETGPNQYRQAWFAMQGEILGTFCRKIEQAAHSVDSKVRIGLSANASSYTQEGIGIHKLCHIIAGRTQPFLRMTGAPYWQALPLFSTNIEAVRIQTQWCGDGIDLITEGDTFPRPRHWVPSALLESYDMILRADGNSHGILKYMLDYTSDADYETGYIDRHVGNQEVYEEISRRFHGQSVGLRIFEHPEILETLEFSDDHPYSHYGEGQYLPLVSQLFTGDNSLPVTYRDGDGAVLVFGESAKHLPEEALANGVILDAAAAKILAQRGIDVGFSGVVRAPAPTAEYLPDNENRILATTKAGVFYDFTLKPGVRVLSTFGCLPAGLGYVPSIEDDSVRMYPACWLYENESGLRFMVYSFTARTVTVDGRGWQSGVFRSYLRQKQLCDGITWLQKGRPLPAVCTGNPGLYILCKKDGDQLTVGLWNLCPDSVLKPEIRLDRQYMSLDCYRCNGKLQRDSVVLDAPIRPYDFAFFTVK